MFTNIIDATKINFNTNKYFSITDAWKSSY